MRGNICKSHIRVQCLEYSKNSYNSAIKRMLNYNTGKGFEDTFSKENIQIASKYMKKSMQPHQSSGTCKSKPQEATVSHPLGRQKYKKIPSVGRGVEKLESSYFAGVNLKWCSCLGKQAGSSSNAVVPQFHSQVFPREMKTYVYTKACT